MWKAMRHEGYLLINSGWLQYLTAGIVETSR